MSLVHLAGLRPAGAGPLDPSSYRPHGLHADDRTYVETNCYVDCLVELVASTGGEPEAMLGGAAAVDWEVDQWGFLKPTGDELRALFGIELHEVQPYRRDLASQLADRLPLGMTLMPEVDAYHLPDTATTSYRTAHVKTSIVVEAIDVEARVLRYFHNAGHHEVTGDDVEALLRAHPAGDGVLPPYVDGIRLHPDEALSGDDLRKAALHLLGGHLTRRPRDNPFDRFGDRLAHDLPGLLAADLQGYHDYAFATARMAGAAFELLASHVRWLFGPDGEVVGAHLDEVVGGTKALLFRLARRRVFDTAALVGPMGEGWAAAMAALDDLALR